MNLKISSTLEAIATFPQNCFRNYLVEEIRVKIQLIHQSVKPFSEGSYIHKLAK